MSVRTRVSSRYRCSLVSCSSLSIPQTRLFASGADVGCSPDPMPAALAFSFRCLRVAEPACFDDGEPDVDGVVREEVVGALDAAASRALGSRTNDEVLGELLLIGKELGSDVGCCWDGGGGNECVFSGKRKKLEA